MTKEEIALEIYKLVFNRITISNSSDPGMEAAKPYNTILETLRIPDPKE